MTPDSIEGKVRRMVADYLADRSSLGELRKQRALMTFRGDVSVELGGEVDLLISEYLVGHRTQQDLRRLLVDAISLYKISGEGTSVGLGSGRFRLYAAGVPGEVTSEWTSRSFSCATTPQVRVMAR